MAVLTLCLPLTGHHRILGLTSRLCSDRKPAEADGLNGPMMNQLSGLLAAVLVMHGVDGLYALDLEIGKGHNALTFSTVRKNIRLADS